MGPAPHRRPHPDCPCCNGAGGHAYDYGDYEIGEYAGTEWDPCPCRTSSTGPWNDEPPF
ncbi:hypothetical protein [Streptomyces sp. NPDC086147]|uniref:hypothetical protein n=1 Tax=Streptomyces sp. NPDC086147 TaxID=3155295 RepID=UPI00344D0369